MKNARGSSHFEMLEEGLNFFIKKFTLARGLGCTTYLVLSQNWNWINYFFKQFNPFNVFYNWINKIFKYLYGESWSFKCWMFTIEYCILLIEQIYLFIPNVAQYFSTYHIYQMISKAIYFVNYFAKHLV